MNFAELLSKHYAAALKMYGFKKKNMTWLKRSDEATLVVNIQKSRWGNWAYTNIGMLIHAIDDLPNPKEYQCHVRMRLQEFCSGTDKALIEGFDRLKEDAPDPREADAFTFAMVLTEQALPIINRISSLKGLEQFMSERTTNSDVRLPFDQIHGLLSKQHRAH